MDWDGNISRDERGIWEVVYRDNIAVKKESCRAEEAYSRLTALTDGSSHWGGAATEYSRDLPQQPNGFLCWA